jgi:hypothetical protein
VAEALVTQAVYPANLALIVTVYVFASPAVLEAPKLTFVEVVEGRLIKLDVELDGV